jgi:DinB family protein
MKTPAQIIAIAACCLTATGAAPNPSAPVSDALRSIAQRSSKNLIAAAEEMPADKYGFKPTPAQMSFGKVITHLSGGNDFLCSKIGGVEEPKRAELAEGAPKEKLVARLRETFQFCESTLAKVNDSDLNGKVPFFGHGEVSRAEAMFAAAEDWADHYSQLAIYLRLNGLLPPTAKRAQS